MADEITRRASAFIDRNKDKPFFLYFATHDIHVPRVPHPRFAGTSQCGTRGDVIQQLDWCVGQIVNTLEKLGIADNTLLIFSSDNGPVLDDGYADGAVKDLNGHAPAGRLRGGKYSIYEGGTRLPMVAWWPGRIKPGASDALVCQVDLLASFAALAGQKMPESAGPDSFNVLPALLGDSPTGRNHLIEHAAGQALRQGAWKFIPGGNAPRTGVVARPQLYNLADDLGEMKNLAAENPQRVKEMAAMLNKFRQAGRSRP